MDYGQERYIYGWSCLARHWWSKWYLKASLGLSAVWCTSLFLGAECIGALFSRMNFSETSVSWWKVSYEIFPPEKLFN